MFAKKHRMRREKKTVEAMTDIYCHDQHKTHGELCPECRELLDYAGKRLAGCPFQENKTTCGKCRVHCYKPVMRERIKGVMRYSGPRMFCRHPVLALYHFIDSFRKQPARRTPQS